ncbi:MAG: hypothetical protein U9N00_02570 [Candidatus Bipolaricaulota bacterium]|nr:hypothetical protein [Candidatus Bipolaricaulota bacterium]
MTVEKMLGRGDLERLALSEGEIDRLLYTIQRRLDDAANRSLHPETRLEQGYVAILNCALAALRAKGLRPTRGKAKHVRTLETLRYTLGVGDDRVAYYQSLRAIRHRGLYEGFTMVSNNQANESMEEAQWLFSHLQSKLEEP